jgi:hypothetical protein
MINFDENDPSGMGPCSTCMRTSCCTQVDTCFASTACAGLNQCLTNFCGTATDLNACANMNCAACLQSAAMMFNAIGQCARSSCASQCGVNPDGGP